MSNTSQSVHGHDLMALMQAQNKALTKTEVQALVDKAFGADARFHTCSKNDMTFDEIFDFLASKKKFNVSEQGFEVNPARICNH